MNDETRVTGTSPEMLEQTPARMVAGALAHLAAHMETGCQRSAYLAAMLLERLASDPEADEHLRRHARQLVDILDAEAHDRLPAASTETVVRIRPDAEVACCHA